MQQKHNVLLILTKMFIFIIIILELGFPLTYETVISDSNYILSSASKNQCNYAQFTNLKVDYSYSTTVRAETNEQLISSSTTLDFSVSDENVEIFLDTKEGNPGLIYTTFIDYTLVDYIKDQPFFSSYFSDQEFDTFENDYSRCELRVLDDCPQIKGYFYNDGKFQCNSNEGDLTIKDYVITDFLKISSNGVENKGDYIHELSDGYNVYENKKQRSYAVCNGDVYIYSETPQSIDFSSPSIVSSTLPQSCFQPGNDGLYKKECYIDVKENVKCYTVIRDFYNDNNGNEKFRNLHFYSPFTSEKTSKLVIGNICHGTQNTNVVSDSVEIPPGGSTTYAFTVENNGDIPIKINSPNDIKVNNGFTFTPNQNIIFPVEIGIGGNAVIDGVLTAPSPLPESFDLEVITYPDKNAVSCDGSESKTTVSTVSVKESCDINLDIINDPVACKGDFNRLTIITENTGRGDVIIDKYRFELEGSLLSSSNCQGDCQVNEGQTKTDSVGVDVPLTNEKYLYLYVDYYRLNDNSCYKTTPPKQIPLLDCLNQISFDLYPDNPIFSDNKENSPLYATFEVWNNENEDDKSPSGSTVTYTLTSGNQEISETFTIDELFPGDNQLFTTQEINCEGSVNLRIVVNPSLPGDSNPSNNILEISQECVQTTPSYGYCKFFDSLNNEVSTTTLYPSSNVFYDVKCYMNENNQEIERQCSNLYSLSEERSDPDINGNLIVNNNIVEQLNVITSPSTTQSSQEIFSLVITNENENEEYSCSLTVNGDGNFNAYSCSDYI